LSYNKCLYMEFSSYRKCSWIFIMKQGFWYEFLSHN
jgi:hypothetical protein